MPLETIIVQTIVNGVVIGSLYLLMAVGFTVVFGLMRIANFSHAEFYMVGAFVAYVSAVYLQFPFVFAVLLAFAAALILGLFTERFILRSMRGDELSGMIATIGIGMILQSLALVLFGPDPRSMPAITSGAVQIGSAMIPNSRILVGVFSILSLAGLYVFFHHSRYGRALRAVVQDEEAAKAQGIKTSIYYPLGFGIGVGFAALAGALMAPVFSVSPSIGFGPMVKAFIVVIVGGLGSIPGAALASLLLGLTESFAGTFLKSSYADMFLFGGVIVFLILRPQGLLGEKG